MGKNIIKFNYILLSVFFVFFPSKLVISVNKIPEIKLSELKEEQPLEYTFSFPIIENMYPGSTLPKRYINIINDTKDDIQINLSTEYPQEIFSLVKISCEEQPVFEQVAIASNSSIVISVESIVNENINNGVQGKKEFIQITLNVNASYIKIGNNLLPKTSEYIRYFEKILVMVILLIFSIYLGKKSKRRRYM